MQYTTNKIQKILKDHKGLHFHLINHSNKTDILFRTLENRGIDDVAKFSNPVPNVDFKPSDPIHQPLTWNLVKWFNNVIQNREKVSILVDNDADGFTSASFMYKYLINFGIKANFVFTYGKNHGIKSYSVKNKLASRNLGYLVIPDASLSLKDIKFLKHWHIPYLIIDHHDLNHQSTDLKDKLHIFNNQWKNTKVNRQFTGVGMVFLFCSMLDKLNHTDYAGQYLYLMSIGQIGDVSDISNPEIRYYVELGFKQMINSKLLKLTTDTDRLSAHELSFSIIPKINAVCRTGSLDDKNDLIKAMVDDEPHNLVKISFRRKSKIDHKFHKHYKNVDHYYLEAKQLNRIRSRQKRAVKKSLKALKHIYETKSFIVALDKSGSFKQEEAGLIATQLSNKYQKPTLVLRTCNKSGYYKGSARGNTKVMKNFRKFCLQTNKFVYDLGHPNASGVMISDFKLKELLHEYKNVDLTDNNIVYNVDNLYINDVPSRKNIIDFDANRDLFGGKIKNPQLGFVGLKVYKSNIKFYGSVFTMKSHHLKFIMFNCPTEFKNKIFNSRSSINFDVYGVPDVNRFMKWYYPQIIIQNIKIVQPIKHKSKSKEIPISDFSF